MSKFKGYEYIVLDYSKQPNEMICQHCKQKQVLPEGPMPFRIWEANLDAFFKIHRKCKEMQIDKVV
jgi:hypothetical protein